MSHITDLRSVAAYSKHYSLVQAEEFFFCELAWCVKYKFIFTLSPSFFDSFMSSCSRMKSSSWLTGARTEVEQADSRMMCMKNAHITEEYTLIWDLGEYRSAFHYGSVEGQGWGCKSSHYCAAGQRQGCRDDCSDSWFMWFSTTLCIMPGLGNAHQKIDQELHHDSWLWKAAGTVSETHTSWVIGPGSSFIPMTFSLKPFLSVFFQAFTEITSSRSENSWQWVEVLTLTFVLLLIISLSPQYLFSSTLTSIHAMR